MERVIGHRYKLESEKIPQVIRQIREIYGDSWKTEVTGDGIELRGENAGDFIASGRLLGIVEGKPQPQLFSDAWEIEEEFDQGIAATLQKRFGDKFQLKVTRAKVPPTERVRGYWPRRPDDEFLFVTGDFRWYDEVVEVYQAVQEAIDSVVREDTEIVVYHRRGRRRVAEYAARQIEYHLHSPVKVRSQQPSTTSGGRHPIAPSPQPASAGSGGRGRRRSPTGPAGPSC